jgi:hypothetical protein
VLAVGVDPGLGRLRRSVGHGGREVADPAVGWLSRRASGGQASDLALERGEARSG